jgi:hypothetical protein
VKDRVGRLGFIEPMLPVAVTSLTTADAPLPNTKLAARDAKMRIIFQTSAENTKTEGRLGGERGGFEPSETLQGSIC